jgi:outer membrane receptor protein involved in Fe transport
LYGGWAAAGSNVDLTPEKSRTVELVANYIDKNFKVSLNPYYSRIDDVIRTLQGGADNFGTNNIFGMVIGASGLIPLPYQMELKPWAYYTYTYANEEKIDLNDEVDGTRRVADIAANKVHFGLTAYFLDHKLSATLRGRYIGEKPVVEGNPIGYVANSDGRQVECSTCPSGKGYGGGKVDGYVTLDLSIHYRDFLAPLTSAMEGLALGLHVKNLTNADYFHPGIREANAGVTPGIWNGGVWNGSSGWTNSLMPQPGTEVLLTLQYEH